MSGLAILVVCVIAICVIICIEIVVMLPGL